MDTGMNDSPLPSQSVATSLLLEARVELNVDDLVLWIRSAGALITEATTVVGGRDLSVDIPLGQGIAGRAFETNDVVVVDDFHDFDSLVARGLEMQQPDVVAREKWRSGIYVPIQYPVGLAVIAAYSEDIASFRVQDASPLETWGERALLRARWDHVGARPFMLTRILENVAMHIHDIRQASDTALMNVEAIRDGSKGASVPRTVESLKKLSAMCERDLRSVMQQRPKSRLCNVSEVVAAVVEDFHSRTSAHHIDLDYSAIEHIAGLIDPVVLRRCLANLIANSITHLSDVHRGRKYIHVTVRAAKGQTEIEVADNGTGIQPDRVGKIFEPGVSFSPLGFGLGLSQVETALSAVGGAVRLTRNDFGSGCAFTLYLPIRS